MSNHHYLMLILAVAVGYALAKYFPQLTKYLP